MLGYTYQNTLVLIGTKSGTTRTAATLPTSYGSTARNDFPTLGMSKVNLSILYTTGAAETNNTIELKIESSPDRTNWYQLPNESVSGGTSTLVQEEFTFSGPSAATAYAFSLPLDLSDLYYRISIKESGVAANAGSVYCEATILGAK